ncbi:MAG: potassium transporter TrkG [bacterium]|nr:potassium transporter TrkG [bacterium]
MRKTLTPARFILLGYIILILIGAAFLSLPIASTSGRCSVIDSVFTATSSICVTGLIVKDIPNDFTKFGKAIILTWIQMGGLGYMMIASLLFLTIGGRLSIRQASITEEAMGHPLGRVGRFILMVVKFTIGFELLGTIILTLHFATLGFPLGNALFKGLFHSVSAFCNAGFTLFSNNLVGFAKDPLVIFTISGLFIIGGLGFIVLGEIYQRLKRETNALTLHTKLVLLTTLSLLILGTLAILGIEWDGVLRPMNLKYKLCDAFFQSATPRTAGFNVVPVDEYKLSTLFFTILLMFIGASPGGTGGGIKTTTFTLLLMSIVAYFRGRKSIAAFGRRVNESTVDKAFRVALIGLLVLILGLIVLTLVEGEKNFIGLMFEDFSAFGTVGLSVGSTINSACSLSYDFSWIGKLVIILTMLAGRVGSLTIGAAIISRGARETFRLPVDIVLTG